MKNAYITGIGGQDGYYLSRLLLGKGYQVFGTDTPSATAYAKSSGDYPGVTFLEIELLDKKQTCDLFSHFDFDEIYNLAGLSFIPASWEEPHANFDINAGIPLNILEAIRIHSPSSRLFQACSSELFGDCRESPQNENTPFHPRSPYSANKIYAYHMVNLYREYRNIFAVNGILYNHESPRRPASFVTRKITRTAAEIKLGIKPKLLLGNLDARRDWSYAGDTVEAIHSCLQIPVPENFVIGSGILHTVTDFCKFVFEYLGLDYRKFVETDPRYYRTEQSVLQADPVKIFKATGWKSRTPLKELAVMMVQEDMRILQQ